MKPGLGLGPWLCAGPLLPYRYKGPSASITVVVAAAAHTRFPIADCKSDTECLLYPRKRLIVSNIALGSTHVGSRKLVAAA